MKLKILVLLVIFSFVGFSFKINRVNESDIGLSRTIKYFKENVVEFASSAQALVHTLKTLDPTEAKSIEKSARALKDCRMRYKRIEFFSSYFFSSETRFYNAAPKFEVEEPTLELVEPMGLQQIEALLFGDDLAANKSLLIAHAEALLSSVEDLNSLLYGFKATDAQVLESLRIELIRTSVLSISGYDAPILKSGIQETAVTTEAVRYVLDPYLKSGGEGKGLDNLLDSSVVYLTRHSDFDSFDRMEYLTKYALPLQKRLGLFISSIGLEINTSKFLNYKADHIYSANALNSWNDAETDIVIGKALSILGKKLFFDKGLSGNLSTSCASCHQPENYFADLVPKSASINKDSTLKRNTPSLLYSGWQHTQFWDGRATNLQSQIQEVIFNPLEMDGKSELLSQNIIHNEKYEQLFHAAFPGRQVKDLGVEEISIAIKSYVQNLDLMDSPFDNYIKGVTTAMSREQVEGFNLFMGKAQCGTCHFPPFFNSLLPPFYDLSEVEVLGTTVTDNFKTPHLDEDRGRQDLFNIRYYNRAFKTPTLRNSAQTAPYMHNGSFASLASVIEFYNLGGGSGLNLDVPDQTLSSKPLNLSEGEIRKLILFLESLTDNKVRNLKI